ncbi:MAG: SpoIID/LytB domain-containing protein [Acidobacteria bacterium]|nr:SpoIID/LytB domain-containing protein [Acidobacteriota bacterium]
MSFSRLFIAVCIVASLLSSVTAKENGYFSFVSEPSVRIGLSTNAGSVTITTADTSLIAVTGDDADKVLSVNRITVAPRLYRPPVIEFFRFEIPNLETQADADDLAKELRDAGEKATASLDWTNNKWRIQIGDSKETIEEANDYKAALAEKGFEDVVIVTEKKTQPSEEAVALSEQLRNNPNPKSENRSLIKPTTSTQPTTNAPIAPNVKEILISGGAESARFSSFKPISFGSLNQRAVPVKLNGKAYRGRVEVFVNSRGSLTVVNVVPIEEYLLGVVPKELGLPSLEAQKAQAVAARTYAIANLGGYSTQGFDLLPTVWSQVYGGVSAETTMGTMAVTQTRGIVGTYNGKAINALYTSTCGGRTENSENIFEFNEPYLRGVECSLEGRKHFEPFLIRSSRELPKVESDDRLELVRLSSQFAVNGFVMATNRFTDEWFDLPPNETELRSWINQLALKLGKPVPAFSYDLVKSIEFANMLAKMMYAEGQTDMLMSESDINYQLSFTDAADIDKDKRANLAMLFRDGWLSLYPDSNFRPHRPMPRAKLLRLIENIYAKRKLTPALQSGEARPTADGKLILKSGRNERPMTVSPNVFLFREFGGQFYQVKEVALIGGEQVAYQTNAAGEIAYLEVKPSDEPTVAEKMSPFTIWNVSLAAGAVQSRLSRYVRGIGTLLDVNIKQKGFSRRATELEIIGTNGRFSLKGGKIRSALRLKEQLFVMNKRYDTGGRVTSYQFTGRGWGHGVGMCQYGAFGLAKMGVKYDAIIKHYYTGAELTKAY